MTRCEHKQTKRALGCRQKNWKDTLSKRQHITYNGGTNKKLINNCSNWKNDHKKLLDDPPLWFFSELCNHTLQVNKTGVGNEARMLKTHYKFAHCGKQYEGNDATEKKEEKEEESAVSVYWVDEWESQALVSEKNHMTNERARMKSEDVRQKEALIKNSDNFYDNYFTTSSCRAHCSWKTDRREMEASKKNHKSSERAYSLLQPPVLLVGDRAPVQGDALEPWNDVSLKRSLLKL